MPQDRIFDIGLFDFEAAHEHPLRAKELYGFADHVPETEEYGVSSFVYRARQPFQPQKVHDVLNGPLPGVLRAKRHFWIATRPNWFAEFSLAGALSTVRPMGQWWATVPEERRQGHPQTEAYLARYWQEPFGDRRQGQRYSHRKTGRICMILFQYGGTRRRLPKRTPPANRRGRLA